MDSVKVHVVFAVERYFWRVWFSCSGAENSLHIPVGRIRHFFKKRSQSVIACSLELVEVPSQTFTDVLLMKSGPTYTCLRNLPVQRPVPAVACVKTVHIPVVFWQKGHRLKASEVKGISEGSSTALWEPHRASSECKSPKDTKRWLLPADKRYRHILCCTTRLQSSFFPQAARLLNSSSARHYLKIDEAGLNNLIVIVKSLTKKNDNKPIKRRRI